MFWSMLINSPRVRKIKWSTLIQLVSCIPFQFQHKNGRAFPWTSSLGCPKYLVRIAYLWWWIASLNFLICLLLLPLSLMHKCMNYLLKKFSDCMGFLRALLVTENKFFSAFWQELFKMAGTNLNPRKRFIHKLMAKHRRWINVWRVTWGTMLVGSKKHG